MNFMDAIPGLKVLDEAGIKKLYFTALEVLERTGVSVPHQEACALLSDAGAKVENEVAYVPGWLVEKAVNSAPKQIIMYTIDGQPSMRLTNGNFYFGTGENTVFMIDGSSGERRRWTKRCNQCRRGSGPYGKFGFYDTSWFSAGSPCQGKPPSSI